MEAVEGAPGHIGDDDFDGDDEEDVDGADYDDDVDERGPTRGSGDPPWPPSAACCCCCTGTGRQSLSASLLTCYCRLKLSFVRWFASRSSQVCLIVDKPRPERCREPSTVLVVPPSDPLVHCSNSSGTSKLASC